MFEGWRLKYYRSRCRGPLRPLLAEEPPRSSTPITQSRLLALDLELTGLQARAEVISVGFVPVDGLRISLAGARRILVRPEGTVASSAHVHMIRDMDLAAAGDLDAALAEVLDALRGRALLVHHAALDHGVLSRLCRERWQAPLIVPVVDTFALARRSAQRAGREILPGSLRLPALRARYGLPVAHLHGALSDAVATAELFLAMVAEQGLQTRLGDWRAG
jgi:DNA polymerase-3 subunit epsilon